MTSLSGENIRICIMATDGFEQSELFVPMEKLKEAGATVDVVSLEKGEIRAWDKKDWGKTVPVDRLIADVDAADYDALVLPGGQINPDLLRVERDALNLVKLFAATGKPVAAICHAPWLLIEAGLVNGRTMTCYKSIRTDLANAGATVVDESVVVDANYITSRNPDDLDDFVGAIVDMLNAKGGVAQAA